MQDKLGDTISVSGKIHMKAEVRTDGKVSKLLALPYGENERIYSRIFKGTKEWDIVEKNIQDGNQVTITGELKGIAGQNGAKVNYMGIDSISVDENNFQRNQILREDAKNAFLEVMADSFEIDKIRINFIKYDTTKAAGSKYTANIPIYLDVNDADTICENILNGYYSSLIKAQKVKKEKGEISNYSSIDEFFGGVSAKKLAARGQARADGKALSRVLSVDVSISPKTLLVLTAQSGPGIESRTGGISPERSAFEQKVQIPLSLKSAQRFALGVRRAINANETSKQVVARLKEEEN